MNGARILLQGFTTALRTLTIVPIPGKGGESFAYSLPWFPVVGIVLGILLTLLLWCWGLIQFASWPMGQAFSLLVVEVWLTRGLHVDGLADWADSLGGMKTREQRFAIMKDSRLGAFGGMALILLFMAKLLAFERLIVCGSFLWVILILTLSRGSMVELIATLPYARSEAGMARPFVDEASTPLRFISHGVSFYCCVVFGPFGLLLGFIAGAFVRVFRNRCMHRFGGITGDLLGASHEMVEAALLLCCAVPGVYMVNHMGWRWIP